MATVRSVLNYSFVKCFQLKAIMDPPHTSLQDYISNFIIEVRGEGKSFLKKFITDFCEHPSIHVKRVCLPL